MIVAWLIAAAWGALVAAPLVARVRRANVRARLTPRVDSRRRARPQRQGRIRRAAGAVIARRSARAEAARQQAELPLVIDLLQVAVGSGCTPRQAVEVGTRWGPAETAAALGGALDGTRLGLALGDALALAVQQHPALAPLVDVLVVSERLGAPAGVALARLSEETRADLRRAAEARARTLPVKLLFPLVFLILPAFGLLTVVPALLRALERL